MSYYCFVIKSFKCRDTEKIYQRQYVRKWHRDLQRAALRKLWMLDAAPDLNALRVPPSNHLESLKGDRQGQQSIRVTQQWRICFVWGEGHAYEVELIDYH